MKKIFFKDNNRFSLIEATVVIVVFSLILFFVFLMYRNYIQPNNYIREKANLISNAILSLEQIKDPITDSYPAVNSGDLTDLSQDLSTNPNLGIKTVWNGLTGGKVNVLYKNWGYECDSSGNTVILTATFFDVSNTELIDLIVNYLSNNFSINWVCTSDKNNFRVNCSRTNIICRNVILN